MDDPVDAPAGQTPGALRGHVARERAPPRIGEPQRDDLVPPRVEARRRDRGFHRLRAAVRETRRAESTRRDLGQRARGLDLAFRHVEGRGVPQPLHLRARRPDDRQVTVSDRCREDPREQVQVLVAVHVREPDALAAGERERLAVVGTDPGEEVRGLRRGQGPGSGLRLGDRLYAAQGHFPAYPALAGGDGAPRRLRGRPKRKVRLRKATGNRRFRPRTFARGLRASASRRAALRG